MDESSVTGESDMIAKCTLQDVTDGKSGEEDIPADKRYCMMVSGSTVSEGTAFGLVVTVGENTYIRKQTKLDADDESPLQEKLADIADQIGNFGTAAAALTVLVIWAKVTGYLIWSDKYDDESTTHKVMLYLEAIIIGISVIVCAIPEGLPLAVTLALAYSVSKMMEDNNLVKKINSCETMGNADCICTDKTGTLTENLMTIKEFWYNQKNYSSTENKKVTKFWEWFRRSVM